MNKFPRPSIGRLACLLQATRLACTVAGIIDMGHIMLHYCPSGMACVATSQPDLFTLDRMSPGEVANMITYDLVGGPSQTIVCWHSF